MGKIRVKTLGDEELEKEQKKAARKRSQAKKVSISTVEAEENKKTVTTETQKNDETLRFSDSVVARKTSGKKEKFKVHKNTRSQKYRTVAKLVDKNKIYSLSEALSLLPQLKIANFDETVELHINTTDAGISGNLVLPHGTGKKVRVAIATDELIAELEKNLPAGRQGKINFDVLLAEPIMMPKLARVAKILGPKGLMPNPKNGTISPKPEDLIKKYEQGQVSFKTEAKIPVIHLSVGKLSFGDKKLEENIKTVVNTIQANRIKKVTLKSTMSPGIKLNFSSI